MVSSPGLVTTRNLASTSNSGKHAVKLILRLQACSGSVPGLDSILHKSAAWITPAILRGYNLICFCPHDWPCHGDILLELANQ